MLKAEFEERKFNIKISTSKFIDLWDESYSETGIGDYDCREFSELPLGSRLIDLDAFVSDQILTILDPDGNEDNGVNNEYFENFGTKNCIIKKAADGVVHIQGALSNL
jgi:hypothetical protein